MWKHCQVEHGGEKAEFSMKQTGVFRSCMVRQVNGAVRIEMSAAVKLYYVKYDIVDDHIAAE